MTRIPQHLRPTQSLNCTAWALPPWLSVSSWRFSSRLSPGAACVMSCCLTKSIHRLQQQWQPLLAICALVFLISHLNVALSVKASFDQSVLHKLFFFCVCVLVRRAPLLSIYSSVTFFIQRASSLIKAASQPFCWRGVLVLLAFGIRVESFEYQLKMLNNFVSFNSD